MNSNENITKISKNKQYTKAEFLKAVSIRSNMTQVNIKKALYNILTQIEYILSKGDSISFLGFGKFSVVKRSARNGRNPQTGEPIRIDPHNIIKFSPGQVLKNAINTNDIPSQR